MYHILLVSPLQHGIKAVLIDVIISLLVLNKSLPIGWLIFIIILINQSNILTTNRAYYHFPSWKDMDSLMQFSGWKVELLSPIMPEHPCLFLHTDNLTSSSNGKRLYCQVHIPFTCCRPTFNPSSHRGYQQTALTFFPLQAAIMKALIFQRE